MKFFCKANGQTVYHGGKFFKAVDGVIETQDKGLIDVLKKADYIERYEGEAVGEKAVEAIKEAVEAMPDVKPRKGGVK